MSLPASKKDYAGLATTGLELRSNGLGKSASVLEKQGASGDIVATEVFGEVAAPSCEYIVTGDLASFAPVLGNVAGTETTPYALQSVSVSTSAGGETTVSASCVQIEAGATQCVCTYTSPAMTIDMADHAQDVCGAFSYAESATLALNACTTTAECAINVRTVNGVPKASDATGGKVTVSGTWWSTTETAPAITAATGWTITAPLTCTGADGDYFTWTATASKAITGTHPA